MAYPSYLADSAIWLQNVAAPSTAKTLPKIDRPEGVSRRKKQKTGIDKTGPKLPSVRHRPKGIANSAKLLSTGHKTVTKTTPTTTCTQLRKLSTGISYHSVYPTR